MTHCPRCGGSAEPDPEHAGVVRCLACWEVWTQPTERHCPGNGRGQFAPALRMLAEYRALNR
ncbi:hypothetical protein AB0451_11160 [Streptomyces sp. NPDC052000]|uniref:hypothetical protein n=1 Tax=Streptomyces sp. NPDC052000 TaxID=3155676 RepID=UPI00344F27F5